MEQTRPSRTWKEVVLEIMLENDPERSLALCIELNDALEADEWMKARHFDERQPAPAWPLASR